MNTKSGPTYSRRGIARFTAAGLLVLAMPSARALAFDEASTSPINTDKQGLMLRGHDPVAYFKQNAAVMGSPQFAATHNGVTYHFASSENREAFLKSPAQYSPEFGGFCAMGAALGRKLDGDPQVFRVVEGKLYLNVNKDVQAKWVQDIPANLKAAETNWRQIRDKAPREVNK